MTVQELFRQTELIRIQEAYFMNNEIFESYEKYSYDQKIDIILKIFMKL